jgi:hypothetical protein
MIDVGNTLYVVTPGAALRLDHDTVRVEVDGATTLRVPLLRLSSIVCFGAISISPSLVERCADDGRGIVLLDRHGRFRARIEGRTKGNVLLRRANTLPVDPERPWRSPARSRRQAQSCGTCSSAARDATTSPTAVLCAHQFSPRLVRLRGGDLK